MRILIVTYLLILLSGCNVSPISIADGYFESGFYYYNNGKTTLFRSTVLIGVKFQAGTPYSVVDSIANKYGLTFQNKWHYNYDEISDYLNTENPIPFLIPPDSSIHSFISIYPNKFSNSSFAKINEIEYCHPSFSFNGNGLDPYMAILRCEIHCITNLEKEELLDYINPFGVTIERNYGSDSTQYILKTNDQSILDPLTMANIFYETGQFRYCQPFFYFLDYEQIGF